MLILRGRAYFADTILRSFARLSSLFGIRGPARELRIADRIDRDSSDARIVALQAPFAKVVCYGATRDATEVAFAIHGSTRLGSVETGRCSASTSLRTLSMTFTALRTGSVASGFAA